MLKMASISRIFLMILILGLVLAACSDQKTFVPKKKTKLTQEESDLIRYYLQVKEAGMRGMVNVVVSERDSVTMDFVMRFFQMRQAEIDSSVVASWAYNWPNVAGLPLIQDKIVGDWRRMLFMIDGIRDKMQREKMLIPMVMFRLEHGQWKFSNASRYSSLKYDENGDPVKIDDSYFHQMFHLPPTFPNLDSLAKAGSPTPHQVPDSIKDAWEKKMEQEGKNPNPTPTPESEESNKEKISTDQ